MPNCPPPRTTSSGRRRCPRPRAWRRASTSSIASHDPSFQKTDNKVSVASVWVSDLALVVRDLYREGVVEGFVLNAKSGEPIAGATVTRWEYDYTAAVIQAGRQTAVRRQRPVPLCSVQADKWSSFLIVAEYQGDKLASANTYSHDASTIADPLPYEQTVFFTDRSLYRPGQTIHYKGICIRVDQTADNYQTLAGRQLTVVFRDVNGQEIARQTARVQRLRLVQRQLHRPAGPADGPDVPVRDRRARRLDELQRRGVQAAEVPGAARAARRGAGLDTRGRRAGQGHGVHRRLHRRGPGRVARRAPGAIPALELVVPMEWPTSQSQAIAHGDGVTDSDGSFERPVHGQAGPVRAGRG